MKLITSEHTWTFVGSCLQWSNADWTQLDFLTIWHHRHSSAALQQHSTLWIMTSCYWNLNVGLAFGALYWSGSTLISARGRSMWSTMAVRRALFTSGVQYHKVQCSVRRYSSYTPRTLRTRWMSTRSATMHTLTTRSCTCAVVARTRRLLLGGLNTSSQT